ncbi:MAG: hypothetical protein RR825_03245, partial [Ruthenibacterium sp.]
GRDNVFGHPHKSALNAFRAVGAAAYRTDENGTIIVSVDAAGNPHVTPEHAANAVSYGAADDAEKQAA